MHKLVAALVPAVVVVVGGVAAPALASPAPIAASGSVSIAFKPETLEIIDQGQQCVVHIEETLTYSGTLDGTAETIGPVELRFFATCAEVLSTPGPGIRRHFSAVSHYVGVDGRQATLQEEGRADEAGNFVGTIAVHGDLNGTLHTAESPTSGPTGTYEGKLVLKG